ncbi:BppU family phage baseplate upper protein [Lactobacillus crispatus]|uniref:BppU family phage baseplate upper protein n=1 Tax=Lactobacillus crispatus TaxID=47770 RepID=A0A7H9E8D0_9LACO|nr:BppU family phage baseplate upper protein [Lactobacillus crispatus]QLL73876.1 BppU family phage baseplate upper protein [Lactobacillus crispatus]
MSLAQITLTTNKTTSNVGDYVRKIGQGERGQILPVIVVDATGTPYDLSDKKIVFSESKDSGKYVVDDGKASTSGKFTLTDPQNGKFSYALQDQVYPESGTAWFDIVSSDGTVLDTTVTFKFVVIPNATLHVDSDSYSSTLEALQAHYQGVIKNTETQTQNLINNLTDKINQAISNGQNDIANELSDARAKLQSIQDQENKLIASWTTELNTQKQNFATLQSQWQEQYKSISDSYQAKINEINTQAQSQHDDIQAAADQQLKDNKSANQSEIAKVENETKAKLDEVEKAKNDAIADLTAQRDEQLKAAKDAYDKQRNDQQADYNSWKEAQIADFTKLVEPLKTEITTDRQDLKDISDQIAATKKEMANLSSQLDSIDVTRFVTGDQFKEAMAKKASGLKVRGLRGDYVMAVDTTTSNIDGTPTGNSGSGLVDSTVLAGVMQTISDAILGKNHYTKAEVDNLLKGIKDQLTPLINQKANASDLNNKADKSQIQSLSSQLGSYKQENDNLKNENSQLTNRVQTLENKQFIAHVASEDQVASQTAPIVIVDD